MWRCQRQSNERGRRRRHGGAEGATSEEEAPVRGGLKVTKLITDTSDNKDGNVDVSGIKIVAIPQKTLQIGGELL